MLRLYPVVLILEGYEATQQPRECLAVQHQVASHLWDMNWCEPEKRVQWLQGLESCLRFRWESSNLMEKRILRYFAARLAIKRC